MSPVLCTGPQVRATRVSRPCTATSWPTSFRDCAVAYGVWRNGGHGICVNPPIIGFIELIISTLSSPDVARCDKDREPGSMPYTSLPCRICLAAPSPLISVFPTPCAPLGSSSPPSYSGASQSPHRRVLPWPNKIRTTGRGSVPLRRSVLSVSDRFRSSAAASDDSDERAGRRARFWAWAYPPLHPFFIYPIHSFSGAPPPFHTFPIPLSANIT